MWRRKGSPNHGRENELSLVNLEVQPYNSGTLSESQMHQYLFVIDQYLDESFSLCTSIDDSSNYRETSTLVIIIAVHRICSSRVSAACLARLKTRWFW